MKTNQYGQAICPVTRCGEDLYLIRELTIPLHPTAPNALDTDAATVAVWNVECVNGHHLYDYADLARELGEDESADNAPEFDLGKAVAHLDSLAPTPVREEVPISKVIGLLDHCSEEVRKEGPDAPAYDEMRRRISKILSGTGMTGAEAIAAIEESRGHGTLKALADDGVSVGGS